MRVKTKHYSGVTSAMVRGSIEINSTLRQRRKCILLDTVEEKVRKEVCCEWKRE